jgi:hypothetical protein
MLPEWGDRETFLPRNLEYMGSFDLESRGYHSIAPGEATLQRPDDTRTASLVTSKELVALNEASLYHVLRSATVTIDGRVRDCPAGKIAYAFERLLLRPWDGLVEIAGQLILHTDDNAAIDATYSGIARFYHPLTSFLPLQSRAYSEGPKSDLAFEAGHAFITIGFDTADQRYAWMGDRQCIAFGTMKLTAGSRDAVDLTADSSYDIYSGS